MPSSVSYTKLLCVAFAAACLLALGVAGSASAAKTSGSGGATFEPPPPPPEKATLVDGRVIAPASAPTRVKRVIEAANRLVEKPYIYGGGHKSYASTRRNSDGLDRGYDCSGAVSYALYGGRFLRSPLPSGALMDWGERRSRPVDHRLRPRRPRLRRGGRPALRHLDARRRRPRPRAAGRAGARRCAARTPSWPATRAATRRSTTEARGYPQPHGSRHGPLHREDRRPARHHRDGAPVRGQRGPPDRRGARPRGQVPRGRGRADEGARPVRGDHPRGVRRDGARPDDLRDDRRGALARLDLDLGHRQHPLHRLLPADEVRHRRAEERVPAPHGHRRDPRRLLAVGARVRLGRAGHQVHRQEDRRRRLGAQRPEDVGDQRADVRRSCSC